MKAVERIRRRDGAIQWGLFEDAANPGRYVESFLVENWAEHLRQHERITVSDRALRSGPGHSIRTKGRRASLTGSQRGSEACVQVRRGVASEKHCHKAHRRGKRQPQSRDRLIPGFMDQVSADSRRGAPENRRCEAIREREPRCADLSGNQFREEHHHCAVIAGV